MLFLSKSNFVDVNKIFTTKFFKDGLITNYWKDLHKKFNNFIDNNFDDINKKEELKKLILPLSMSSIEFKEFKKNFLGKEPENENISDPIGQEISLEEENNLNLSFLLSGIEGLNLRLNKRQIVENITELLDKFNKLSYEEWLSYYNSQQIKSTALKFLYLNRLKKEDYNEKVFSFLLSDLNFFEKYEFLYPLLNKYLEFNLPVKALSTLIRIHKLGGLGKDPIGIKNKYSDFYVLIGNYDLSNINDFNIFLDNLFKNKHLDLAIGIFKKINSVQGGKRDLLLVKDEETEKIYYKNLDIEKINIEFEKWGYKNSEKTLFDNTYLVLAERYLEKGKIDIAIRILNKLKYKQDSFTEEFKIKNKEFIEKYYSLNLDFSDEDKLLSSFIKGFKDEKTYYNTLDVIKSMRSISIKVQHKILYFLKDEDLLVIFNRTLGAKAIGKEYNKHGGLGEYALDFLKRFISIGDKSRSLSSFNSLIALGIKIPDELRNSYNEMIKIGDYKNVRLLGSYKYLEDLFIKGNYNEAVSYYRNNKLDLGHFMIYLENISDEDFAYEYKKGLNFNSNSNQKFLNICLNRLLNLDLSKIPKHLFLNRNKSIDYVVSIINKIKVNILEYNIQKYNDYINKKESGNLEKIYPSDNELLDRRSKLKVLYNLDFSREETKFINNIKNENKYSSIKLGNKTIKLPVNSRILYYLLSENYKLGLNFFYLINKSNSLIYILSYLAEEKDFCIYKEQISKFLSSIKKGNGGTISKSNPEKTNKIRIDQIRTDKLFYFLESKLSRTKENDIFLNNLQDNLERIGFNIISPKRNINNIYLDSNLILKESPIDNNSANKILNTQKLKQAFISGDFDIITKLLKE